MAGPGEAGARGSAGEETRALGALAEAASPRPGGQSRREGLLLGTHPHSHPRGCQCPGLGLGWRGGRLSRRTSDPSTLETLVRQVRS